MKKSALITGAAAGIGAEVCALLAARNFDLTVLDIDTDALEATAHRM